MPPTNVGSLGGLLAMQRGETHIAGTHLLDPASGVYNIPDIQRAIPNVPVVLVHLAQREQGISSAAAIRKRCAAWRILRVTIYASSIASRARAREFCWITSSRN